MRAHDTSSPVLSLEAVSKTYGHTYAVERLDLSVHRGELLTLLGPSGSGKTTTLMMLAGLAYPDEGRILMNGQDVTYMPPQHRNMGVVFQSYALFPHMSILENVMFSLRARGIEREESAKQARAALAMTQLEQFESRLPSQLSGGQQQRVALARALVFRPPVLLMDEPLGALDKNLRADMQTEIKEIQRELGFAIVHVTHDQEEALAMSDRIAVLADGRLRQLGTPRDLYHRPVDSFVATFLGEANLIAGRVAGVRGDIVSVDLHGGTKAEVQSNKPPAIGQAILVCIRPERISIAGEEAGPLNRHDGVIRNIRYLGDASTLLIEIEGGSRIKIKVMNPGAELSVGDRVSVRWKPADGLIFVQ